MVSCRIAAALTTYSLDFYWTPMALVNVFLCEMLILSFVHVWCTNVSNNSFQHVLIYHCHSSKQSVTRALCMSSLQIRSLLAALCLTDSDLTKIQQHLSHITEWACRCRGLVFTPLCVLCALATNLLVKALKDESSNQTSGVLTSQEPVGYWVCTIQKCTKAPFSAAVLQ